MLCTKSILPFSFKSLRKYMWIENVGHLRSKDHDPVWQYLLEEIPMNILH